MNMREAKEKRRLWDGVEPRWGYYWDGGYHIVPWMQRHCLFYVF